MPTIIFIILGAFSLVLSLAQFFIKSRAERSLLGARGQTKEELEENTIYARYFQTPRLVFFGLMIVVAGIGNLVEIYMPEPKNIWANSLFLVLAAFFAGTSILLLVSKRFSDVFWRHVWHYSDLKRETR